MAAPSHSKILILDFGAQYTQLIARRLRETHVYCEIHPYDVGEDFIRTFAPRGVVLSGGPNSVTEGDTPRAPEAVWTQGVPVLSAGQDEFAAFYVRESGFRADRRIDSPEEQARFVRTKWDLGLAGGVLLSTPVPTANALPRCIVDGWIEQALADAAARGVRGKAVTPFLLARIEQLSGGRSLETNIALVKHNAEVGARLAVALDRRAVTRSTA